MIRDQVSKNERWSLGQAVYFQGLPYTISHLTYDGWVWLENEDGTPMGAGDDYDPDDEDRVDNNYVRTTQLVPRST